MLSFKSLNLHICIIRSRLNYRPRLLHKGSQKLRCEYHTVTLDYALTTQYLDCKRSCELQNLTTGLQYARAERGAVLCCESHVLTLKKIYRKKSRVFLLSSSLGPSSPFSSQLVQMCTPCNTERKQSQIASHTSRQRVLNDFQRTRLFCGHMNPAPPTPPLPSASCLSFSVFLCVAGRAY